MEALGLRTAAFLPRSGLMVATATVSCSSTLSIE
jgi:hypothetical protein